MMTTVVVLFAVLSVITIALAVWLAWWFWKKEGVWNVIAAVATLVMIVCIIAIWVLAWRLQDCITINILTK